MVSALGRGGMGEVYRADDLELGGVVALKFLPADLERDQRRLEMLLAEARIARTVSHPNVCRVHDIGIHRDEHGGQLYFVSMEYVDGEDLASLLRRIERLPRGKALDVARELCAGLAAVHACGLLHRDIKPSNVMLDGRGHVRLADFGVAIVGSEATGLAGTPAYMAPEQHTVQETTARSDVYALGLVLYEIFTGQPAFSAQSPREYAWRHLRDQPAAPSSLVRDLHPEIERVILACLEKIPERRLASAEAVAEALAQVGAEGAVAAFGTFKQGEVLRALLVCDLVGSTALVESLGDRRAAELGTRHDRVARDLLARHAGREIDKTDGFLLLFERPIHALRFALDYHEALAGLSLEARVGIHFGEVWLRENPQSDVLRGAKPIEVDGLAKVVAARLMSLAQGRQTLLSSGAFDLARRAAVGLEGAEDLRWLDHGAWNLHGVADPVDVYEVGREGRAPLAPPSETEKVHRLLAQSRIEGWRPAPGLHVPGRPYWQIETQLGVGGFGEAWLARHAKTHEARCFKFCFDADRLRALQREITLFRLLKEELGEREDINRLLDWNLEQAPYFVESEYTSSGDLVGWAENEGGLAQIPLAVRLEIVAQVAGALAAAHSVGVLHKDVKPSNVLIQRRADGSVQAQLADFGVGQVTEEERLAAAGITVLGLSRRTRDGSTSSQTGTPLYLAPELLEGRTPTLQADIYALGVLLYQIVVGDFRRVLAQGWKREIEDELLAGDIACFIDGAPEQRPASATEVAQRLRTLEQRRREHQAAEAARRAQEASQRRRTVYKAVAITASVALVAVSVLAIWALRAGREERRARETTEQVLNFMIDVFETTDPSSVENLGVRRGETITARELLDRGAERVEAEFVDKPLVQARLLATYGDIYVSLGLYEKAQRLHEQALAVSQRWLGAEHPDTLHAMHGLSRTLYERGEYARCKELSEKILKVRMRVLGVENLDTLRTMRLLASSLVSLGEYAEGKRLDEETLGIQTRLLGAEHPDTLRTMNNLASSLLSLGEYAEAKRLYEQNFKIQARLLGAEHPDTLKAMGNLAICVWSLGEFAEAKRLFEQTLQIRIRLLGAEHPDTLRAMGNLATTFSSLGEYAEAKRLNEETLEIQTRVLGAEHPFTLNTMGNLATSLSSLGEHTQAGQLLEKCLKTQKSGLGIEHEDTLVSMHFLAIVLSRQGNLEEAEVLQQHVLETARNNFGEKNQLSLDSMRGLGEIVSLRSDWNRAKQLQEEALEIHERLLPPDHPDTEEVRIQLAGTLLKLGEIQRARELAQTALEKLEVKLGPQYELTTQAAQTLLEIAMHEHDTAASRRWIEKLRWLTETAETSIDSARQRETRRYVLEVMRGQKVGTG